MVKTGLTRLCGDGHIRCCERLGVRRPRATLLFIAWYGRLSASMTCLLQRVHHKPCDCVIFRDHTGTVIHTITAKPRSP
jgi:hypothetical protein